LIVENVTYNIDISLNQYLRSGSFDVTYSYSKSGKRFNHNSYKVSYKKHLRVVDNRLRRGIDYFII